ncbi:MAG: hypothetical protein LBV60_10590 [Streptomyces sp.]|jgi:hypothetical protein|nr:hypothetical protein [Streptomyces sp.]
MKVRVVLTLDVDPEEFKSWWPLAVQRAGGVREAARAFAYEAVRTDSAVRNGSIRSVTLATEKPREI